MNTTQVININNLVEALKASTNDVIFITTDNLSNEDYVRVTNTLASEPDHLLSEFDVKELLQGKQLNRFSNARKFMMRDEHSCMWANCKGDTFLLTSNGTCRKSTIEKASLCTMQKQDNLFIVNFF